MLDRFNSPPPPPESSQLPRPECGQCNCRIGLSDVKAETRRHGSVWMHYITQHCSHCAVEFVAKFRRDAGGWTFVKTWMITAAERANLGRRQCGRKRKHRRAA